MSSIGGLPLGARVRAGLVAGSVVAIALATLLPYGGSPNTGFFECLVCGRRGVADAIANVLLFAPLGVTLALQFRRALVVVIAAFMLSVALELAQVPMSSRDANLGDVLFNTLGSCVGLLAVRTAPQWLSPGPRGRWALFCAAACLACGTVFVSGVLAAPALNHAVREILVTPRRAGFPLYAGRLLHAELGRFDLLGGRVFDRRAAGAVLAAGAPLELRVTAATATPGISPIIILNAERGRELVLVAIAEIDVVVRVRSRAAAVRLDQPDLRFAGALRGVARSDTVNITLWRDAAGYCVQVGRESLCGVGLTVGEAWAFVFYPPRIPSWLRALFSGAWLAGLLAPAGFWSPRDVRAVLVWSACLGTLLATPTVTAAVETPLYQVVGALLGLGFGLVLGSSVRASHQKGVVPAQHSVPAPPNSVVASQQGGSAQPLRPDSAL